MSWIPYECPKGSIYNLSKCNRIDRWESQKEWFINLWMGESDYHCIRFDNEKERDRNFNDILDALEILHG